MVEEGPNHVGDPGAADKTKTLLMRAADQCSGLAGLLRKSGRYDDADVLTLGSRTFSEIISSEAGVGMAMEIIANSFGEDGPRLPSLVRGIRGLSQYQEDKETSPKMEEVASVRSCGGIPQIRAGNIRCILDDSDRFLATIDRLGTAWLNNFRNPPFYFGRHGDFRFTSFSPYYKEQQVIIEAFFNQDGGALLLPGLSDVIVYSVGEYKRMKRLHESWLLLNSRHFFKHAGQLIYKIHHLDEIRPGDFTGWRKFKSKMDAVKGEYQEVFGRPVTVDELVKVALRDRDVLLSLGLEL